MEPFSALLALCAGNSPVPVNSPHKEQWRGPLMFSLICVWINDWVNNREAGDLRRHRGHYDVNVMLRLTPPCWSVLITYGGRYHFNLFSIPAYFDSLLDRIFVWDFQDKFSSKIIPRFLNSETGPISMPLISRVGINPVMSFERMKYHEFGLRYIQRELV